MTRLSEDTHEERQRVACIGKAIFTTPHAANKRAKSMRRKHDRGFGSYRCKFCRGWHVGSRDPWQDKTL